MLRSCFPNLPSGGCWPQDGRPPHRGCFPDHEPQPARPNRAPSNNGLKPPGAPQADAGAAAHSLVLVKEMVFVSSGRVARGLALTVRQREQDNVKRLAFVIGILISAAGVAVMVFPSGLISFSQHSITRLELYAFAVVRIGIGVLFIAVAPASRMPKVLRVFGALAVVAGVLTPLVGVTGARIIADWWSRQGLSVVRAVGVLPLAIGGLIMYACAPVRRAA